jgi:hypothetical protein
MGEVSLPGVVQSFAAQMAAFQALLLAVSAIHKLARWTRSLSIMREFAGVPGALAAPALGAAAAVELTAGALLTVPAWCAAGAVLAGLVWTLYLVLIVRAIADGRRDADCGCSFGTASRSLGSFQVARNLVLTALAFAIAAVSAFNGPVPAPGTYVLGGLAFLALYGALDQVMALQPLRSGELT